MTSAYDAWLTTDRNTDNADQLYDAFCKSDEYMSAYVDHCDNFESSSAYDVAFEKWLTGLSEEDTAEAGDGYDPDLDFYGLTPDEEDRLGWIDPWGNT